MDIPEKIDLGEEPPDCLKWAELADKLNEIIAYLGKEAD